MDLLAGDDAALKKTLAEKISSVDTISHVYYVRVCMSGAFLHCIIVAVYVHASNRAVSNICPAYRAGDIPAEECQRLNKEMLRAAVQTLETLSPRLSFVTLITGTKVCHLHFYIRDT